MNELKIIFENNDIIIVDKPSGMPTHPSRLHQGDSLADALSEYFSDQTHDFVFRAVNRLDRDTSGLVMIAKNKSASGYYNRLMREHRIHREYEATVEDDGSLPDSGYIDAPIARANTADPHDISRKVDFEKGEPASTHFRVIRRHPGEAEIKLSLETGRTHQIRVHMAYIGHPVIGDRLYNPHAASHEHMQLRATKLTVDGKDIANL